MYFDEFSSKTEMAEAFELPYGSIDDCEILFAAYTYESYRGNALVLFKRDGQLYEVNGSHCSCYGLEGQWEPEQTTVAALKMRSLYTDSFDKDDWNWHEDEPFKKTQKEFRQVVDSLDV